MGSLRRLAVLVARHQPDPERAEGQLLLPAALQQAPEAAVGEVRRQHGQQAEERRRSADGRFEADDLRSEVEGQGALPEEAAEEDCAAEPVGRRGFCEHLDYYFLFVTTLEGDDLIWGAETGEMVGFLINHDTTFEFLFLSYNGIIGL